MINDMSRCNELRDLKKVMKKCLKSKTVENLYEETKMCRINPKGTGNKLYIYKP